MLIYLLSLLIYLTPILVLLYMSAEIYIRNKEDRLHKTTALLFVVFSLIPVSCFIVGLHPEAYRERLVLLLTFFPATLLLTFVLLFVKELALKFSATTRSWYSLLAYVPVPCGIGLLCKPSWVYLEFSHGAYFTHYYPSKGLDMLIIGLALYTMIVSIFIFRHSFRQNRASLHKALYSKQFILILTGILASASWGILFAVVAYFDTPLRKLDIPDAANFALLIFAGFIRYSMTRYSFMPSVENKYMVLHELSPMPVLLLDHELTIKESNPAARQAFQEIRSELDGLNVRELLSWADAEEPEPTGLLEGEYYAETGERRTYFKVSSKYIDAEEQNFLYVILTNITDYKVAEEQITYMVYHDALTGLSNRRHFQQLLQEACQTSRRTPISVALIDLDGFKQVNDAWGHHAGDYLLQHTAEQLKRIAATALCVARLGGDEFAIVLKDSTEQELTALARSLIDELQQPVAFENGWLRVSASIGIYTASGEQSDELLLREADRLMYAAKHSGKNQYRFTYKTG
ncbi:sensor domain-containing diguanylate cyclase [Paenibacillus athensensis]|uniref:GGDEF domain-containing protein n=1 Tax=Paenibacillus athensensis TaxID=1967502 RepID=A0A4Y8Q5Z3_9BACL|nr:sensor domain-containing diguanylate cyclase [Paenibacillus athensensis]MCD1259873.1 sensor domain-containing diguanylate cyclase [Paenibacillus athensensis]